MHYDERYFQFQRSIGAFGGVANLYKFEDFVKPEDVVVDFGCGGGYLLRNLHCAHRVGIEINPTARAEAQSAGIGTYERIQDLPDNFCSLVISNHALEHVEQPLDTLRALIPKMQKGARLVFVVPHDGMRIRYIENDIDQHLYTWNPSTLGNLVQRAGFCNIRCDVIRCAWTPRFRFILNHFGEGSFRFISHMYALYLRDYQLRVVAERL